MGELFVDFRHIRNANFPNRCFCIDSDSQGRTPAFNLTLLVTSIFGILSAFAPTFPWLCLALFGLGTGVGGSMPTDGTLYVMMASSPPPLSSEPWLPPRRFLENIPKTHHYLLTALSAL